MILLTVVALLSVALLALSSIVLYTNQVTTEVNKQVQTTAAVSAVVIGDQTSDLVTIAFDTNGRPDATKPVYQSL